MCLLDVCICVQNTLIYAYKTRIYIWVFCMNLIYDLRSLFKIRARDWSKSISVFWLPGNESFECVITITQEKCAVLKMARSKTSRKLYLQVDKANKLMKILMNSTIKTRKENNLENFYRQR